MGKIPVPLFYYKEEMKNMAEPTLESLQQQIDVLMQIIDSMQVENAEMFNHLNNMYRDIADTRSVTTTTPPTADGTGLPAFVVLDTKPEVEYKNYVYIYPRE